MDKPKRNARKEKTGKVISDKMDKTRTIIVERLVRHAFYGKTLKRFSKFKAHDEKNESKEGDLVRITETRPLSKTKRWRITEIIERAKQETESTGEVLEVQKS